MYNFLLSILFLFSDGVVDLTLFLCVSVYAIISYVSEILRLLIHSNWLLL